MNDLRKFVLTDSKVSASRIYPWILFLIGSIILLAYSFLFLSSFQKNGTVVSYFPWAWHTTFTTAGPVLQSFYIGIAVSLLVLSVSVFSLYRALFSVRHLPYSATNQTRPTSPSGKSVVVRENQLKTRLLRYWSALRVFTLILGVAGFGVGARVAYDGDRQKDAITNCLSGLSCPYKVDQFTLQGMLANAKAELYLGLALAVVGAFVMAYSFFFMLPANRLAPSN